MAALGGSVACGSASMPTAPADIVIPAAQTDAPAATLASRSTTTLLPGTLTPAALAGTWTLFSVDGARLPVVVSRYGDTRIELLSHTLTLRADGTSTERAESRFTAGKRVQVGTTV